MHSWLYIKCLHIHAWKKSCHDSTHSHEVVVGPLNGSRVDFLIHDTVKPQTNLVVTNDNVVDEAATGNLTIEMLDLIFQRRIPTTVSIPPPCRLKFSRTLKTALDNVLAKSQDLVAWLRLLLLPVCILNLYMPKLC